MNSELLICLVLVVAVWPVIVYLSVKLGTYAFFRGKQLFEETNDESKK